MRDVSDTSKRSKLRGLAALLLLTICIAVAGCGDDDDAGSGASGDSANSGASAQQYSATLEELYEGDIKPPPSTGPKAVKGKNVWLVVPGLQFYAVAVVADTFEKASKELGWNGTVVDAAASNSSPTKAMSQAIAGGADGIISVAIDCPVIKSQLIEARQRDIPVISFLSLDCNESKGGGEKLFTAPLKWGGVDRALDVAFENGVRRGQYVAAASEGEAKIIDVHEVAQEFQIQLHEGFLEGIKDCPNCEIVADVPYTWAQVGTLGSKISAALVQHRNEATWMNVPADTLMQGSVLPAVRRAGLAGEINLMGVEGFPPNVELAREGLQAGGVAYSNEWFTYAAMDVMNRIFAEGENAENPDQGGGFLAWDKDHNLPPGKGAVAPPIDFASMYEKLWATGSSS